MGKGAGIGHRLFDSIMIRALSMLSVLLAGTQRAGAAEVLSRLTATELAKVQVPFGNFSLLCFTLSLHCIHSVCTTWPNRFLVNS